MKSIIFRLFWRIILPFVLALVISVSEIMEMLGRGGRIPFFVFLISFCVFFGIALWNTLHWGREAEEFEAELKEADEIEKEHRRRANWIVRE